MFGISSLLITSSFLKGKRTSVIPSNPQQILHISLPIFNNDHISICSQYFIMPGLHVLCTRAYTPLTCIVRCFLQRWIFTINFINTETIRKNQLARLVCGKTQTVSVLWWYSCFTYNLHTYVSLDMLYSRVILAHKHLYAHE